MAALRALLVFAALIGFFLVGAPLQWLVATRLPRHAHVIPLIFCRTLLAILRVRVAVTGTWAKGGPLLIAANHISWIDILAFGGLMPFCFLAKSEVSRWPLVSAFAGVQGTVFVDRQRRRTIPRANRELASRMLEGRIALLFPEATTLAGPLPGRFYTSHFAAAREVHTLVPGAAVAVQPVAIAYSAPEAAWVGDDNLMSHLWTTLTSPPLTCRIAFGTPIPYPVGANRKSIGRATREAIIAMLETRVIPAVVPEAVERPATATTGW